MFVYTNSRQMILNKLSVLNYKNIHQVELTFSNKINCFFGNNGMGKTNLLDAIYYLSFCKSHIHTLESQIIKEGEELCVIQGDYDYDGRDENIFCAIRMGKRKQFKRNKKEYDKLSEHIGLLPLVMISPADSDLIYGGSDERRRFVDMIISQYDKPYLHTLIQYNKTVSQRNALLKEQSRNHALYDVLEMQLSMYANTIYEKRSGFIEQITPYFDEYYQTISRSNEQVRLQYLSPLEEDKDLESVLKKSREYDKVLGYTSKGIHKDDIEMTLGGKLIRRVGSQGQSKTYLIALKLAQLAFMSTYAPTSPILLLDDIFDKLDANRVEEIIKLVADERFGQIFITDTNRKYLDQILLSMPGDYTLYEIEQGEATPLEKSSNS